MVSGNAPRPEPSCPTKTCENHDIPISKGRGFYRRHGKTEAGSLRYLCHGCGKRFSVKKKSTARQRQPHKNRRIFKLLVNRSPLKRIIEIEGINPKTLYQRIDFFYRQCRDFSAHRERRLSQGKRFERLYLAVDRQTLEMNWTSRFNRRNVVFLNTVTSDTASGYILASHLNFAPDANPELVETEAQNSGDYDVHKPYRKFARLWLYRDYIESLTRSRGRTSSRAYKAELASQIDAAYQEFNQRSDIESADEHDATTQLPPNGMQVHDEYTLYAHFLYLKSLLPNCGKLRFFLDQDSPIRAACLSAFHQEIKDRVVDAFYVRINKSMTVNEKKKAKQCSQEELEAMRDANPSLTDQKICNLLAQEQVASMSPHGKWNDLWFMHPLPDMTEPEKAICHLTDMGDYSVEHRANLYLKATLKSTDRYFMQLRRMISLIERPISTASANQRRWHGYHAYNPNMIVKLLTIYRAYYNYVKVSDKHGTTPAQRIGLARAPADINSIIYF